MLDDVRGYLQLATGLTEVTANKAKEVAMALVGQGFTLSTKAPDVVGQVQELADDLVSTSKNNREMLIAMIRSEVDKAVGRVGFVREDELAALRRHVQRLEQQLDELRAAAQPDGESVGTSAERTDVTRPRAKPAPSPKPTTTGSGDAGAADTAPVVRKKKKVVIEPGGSAADAG